MENICLLKHNLKKKITHFNSSKINDQSTKKSLQKNPNRIMSFQFFQKIYQ